MWWLAALNHIKIWEMTFTQTLLTRYLRHTEIQVRHAHGEMQLGDIPCGRGTNGKRRAMNEGRTEGRDNEE